jgi:hypothetical protein
MEENLQGGIMEIAFYVCLCIGIFCNGCIVGYLVACSY